MHLIVMSGGIHREPSLVKPKTSINVWRVPVLNTSHSQPLHLKLRSLHLSPHTDAAPALCAAFTSALTAQRAQHMWESCTGWHPLLSHCIASAAPVLEGSLQVSAISSHSTSPALHPSHHSLMHLGEKEMDGSLWQVVSGSSASHHIIEALQRGHRRNLDLSLHIWLVVRE